MTVSMSDVQEQDAQTFEAIPKGRYPAVVKKLEYKATGPNSKNPGAPMLSVQFAISEGEYVKRNFFANITMHPDYLGVSKKQFHTICSGAEDCSEKQFASWMKAMGDTSPWDEFLERVEGVFIKMSDSKKLIGSEVSLDIKVKPHYKTGEPDNEVSMIIPREEYEEVASGDGNEWDD